jgi:hypothetical protein
MCRFILWKNFHLNVIQGIIFIILYSYRQVVLTLPPSNRTGLVGKALRAEHAFEGFIILLKTNIILSAISC